MTPTWIFIVAAYGLTVGVVTILALTTYTIMYGTEHHENQWSLPPGRDNASDDA